MLSAAGAEYVNISWINPNDLGTPAFNQFRIEAVSTTNIVNLTIEATNADDPLYVNELVIEGLRPSTVYSISVRTVSTVEQLGSLISESSQPLVFNTTVGGKKKFF